MSMLFAQLSDLHILKKGGIFGEKIDPAKRVRQAIAALNRMRPKIAALLVSGDLTESGTRAEYEELYSVLREVRHFPVYLLPGNHDDAPLLREVFIEHRYFACAERCFWSVEHNEVRLIGLDTTVEQAAHGVIDSAQLEWLEQILESDSKATIVALHHPPLKTHLSMMDQWGLRNAQMLEACLRKHVHVRLITCGHLHRALSARFANTRLNVCPSTSFALTLELHRPERLSWSDEGGHFQVHDYSGGDFLTWTMPCCVIESHSFFCAHPT